MKMSSGSGNRAMNVRRPLKGGPNPPAATMRHQAPWRRATN
jgi:hypothetical protein